MNAATQPPSLALTDHLSVFNQKPADQSNPAKPALPPNGEQRRIAEYGRASVSLRLVSFGEYRR